MPQASDALRREFPDGDAEALQVISENFVVDRTGIIYPKQEGYTPTPRENSALDYLFYEWDYEYHP